MIDETIHPHYPQLTQCREQIKSLRETLYGNGKVGLTTAVYAMEKTLNGVCEQLEAVKKQNEKVQRLIWITFGTMFTANLFMKGNFADLIKTILGTINY